MAEMDAYIEAIEDEAHKKRMAVGWAIVKQIRAKCDILDAAWAIRERLRTDDGKVGITAEECKILEAEEAIVKEAPQDSVAELLRQFQQQILEIRQRLLRETE